MSGRVRAAGRTLTVGELREALAGLDDNLPVRILADPVDTGGDVESAEGDTTRLALQLTDAPGGNGWTCMVCGSEGAS